MTKYQQYCNLCKEKGIVNPYKTEESYNRAYGVRVEPIVPTVIKSKPNVLTTDSYSSTSPKVKAKTIKPDKPKRPYIKRDTTWKRPAKTNRVMVAPKFSYKDMSNDDIKAHKARLAREWRARTGFKPKRTSDKTDAELEKQREYKKQYYLANKEVFIEKARIKRENYTEEDRLKNTIRTQEWRKKQKELNASNDKAT